MALLVDISVKDLASRRREFTIRYMIPARVLAVLAALWMAAHCIVCLSAAEVRGYSVIKGQFFLQTGTQTLILDPDFHYSILGSVDMTDFQMLQSASMTLPDGSKIDLEDIGDSWSYLDSQDTYSELNSIYGWGRYVIDFTTRSEGSFSCPIDLPQTTLPPRPRLVNFDQMQAIDPYQPLILQWDFSAPPRSNDFVQVYINYGHGEVFSTPNLGEAGALDNSARSLTPPCGDTLVWGRVQP